MEEELESFADHEYEPRKINGRMTLNLHGEEDKRKKVDADKIPKLYEAMREGWDIKIHFAVIDGAVNIREAGLEQDEARKYLVTGDVIFLGTIFTGRVLFVDAIFAGRVMFWDAIFTGYAKFFNNTFSWGVSFDGTTFNDDVSFDYSTFTGDANFWSVKLKSPADFTRVVIRENTVWRGLWNYLLRPLPWLILWLSTFGKVRLPKATFTDIFTINTNIVMDTSSNPRLKRYIDDEQWIESWRSNPKWRRLRQIPFWIWEITSHCGRSMSLWAFWSVLVASVFGFLHKGHIVVESVNNWYTPFYFSVVTFTTLGFGDVKPEDWVGQFWITLEVVLGYVMLGGLISIFANKFARRS